MFKLCYCVKANCLWGFRMTKTKTFKIGFLFVFACLLGIILSNPAQAAKDKKKAQNEKEEEYLRHPKEYTVEESYEFFSRQRTPFDPKKSKLSPAESKYLDHFFFVTDLAFKARVNMMQYFFTGKTAHKKHLPEYIKKIDDLIQSFGLIETPSENMKSEDMKNVEELLVQALEEQKDFFKEWSTLKGAAFIRMRDNYEEHLLVQSSHMKLQRVYTQLMLIYPDEDPYNHKAFFNHLAALDFEPWK